MTRRFQSIVVFIVWLSLSTAYISHGQDQLAAVLQVTHAGVELQRANTVEWLPLRKGSESPVGTGDTLRTTDTGRAYLTVDGKLDLLILPTTIFTLKSLAPHELGADLEHGIAVLQIDPEADFEVFAIETAHFTVNMPTQLMAVWSDAERNSSVLVAAGSTLVQSGGETFTVAVNQGFLAGSSSVGGVGSINTPLTAANLEGELFGCPGIIQTGGLNLNVRVAPGLESTVIGNIANETPIQLMGVNAFDTWYRIQAFSGFGWVQKALVNTECQDLPVLPRGFSERNPGIRDVLPLELALLEPFYGPPEEDLWFYLSLASQ
ncbi:MAG: SH3 domain-containing protein [Anaerolineae bacterium]|nr:SH3 domain-containing protein [Anaerolineae bacterium]